jgi:hypothetical protein
MPALSGTVPRDVSLMVVLQIASDGEGGGPNKHERIVVEP